MHQFHLFHADGKVRMSIRSREAAVVNNAVELGIHDAVGCVLVE